MINTRVLEVLKSPELFSEADLKIFEEEINKYPYIQSLRAVYLVGVHQFRPQQYQTELVKTAAYTTDKKILYQLINKEGVEPASEKPEAKEAEAVPQVENAPSVKTGSEVFPLPKQELKTPEEPVTAEKTETDGDLNTAEDSVPQAATESCTHGEGETCIIQSFYSKKYEELKHTVFVNGERNRILFEGEEDFMTTEPPQEEISGKINTVEENSWEEEKLPVTPEPEIEEDTSISFHGVEEFMPQTPVFATSTPKETGYQPPKDDAYARHLEEMEKLIAEVEAKMNASKKTKTEEPDVEPAHQHEINFAPVYADQPGETPVSLAASSEVAKEEAISSHAQDTPSEIEEPETEAPENQGWQPMHVEMSVPDAILKSEKQQQQEKAESNTDKTEEPIEEASLPVLTVSFLSDETQITKEELLEIQEEQEIKTASNIPEFIDTWQSWLKIDRSNEERVEPLSVEEIKSKAIDKFIENEPKISRAKDEGTFTIKEKSTDISHLMTETLAQLYVAQKLYTKAIQAYELLADKHPEKRAYFMEKIQEVKDKRL